MQRHRRPADSVQSLTMYHELTSGTHRLRTLNACSSRPIRDPLNSAPDWAHYGRHYLARMSPVPQDLEVVRERRPESVLLSGGCDLSGGVPLGDWPRHVAESAPGVRINCHAGLVPNTAEEIARWADNNRLERVLHRDDQTSAEAPAENLPVPGDARELVEPAQQVSWQHALTRLSNRFSESSVSTGTDMCPLYRGVWAGM